MGLTDKNALALCEMNADGASFSGINREAIRFDTREANLRTSALESIFLVSGGQIKLIGEQTQVGSLDLFVELLDVVNA